MLPQSETDRAPGAVVQRRIGVIGMKTGEGGTLKIAVGIATIGRPDILAFVVSDLLRQTRMPDKIVICAPGARDVGKLDHAGQRIQVLNSRPGLCAQRNRIARHVWDQDVLVFFDDDFIARADYLEVIDQLFSGDPSVVMATGHVVADGILGPGLSVDEARFIVENDVADAERAPLQNIYNCYGCNMAIRLEPMRQHSVFFDENLPLYGWLEDVDFSRHLSPYGRIVKSFDARGVHLGVKKGRQSGIRLGYSQIANPLYLARKGTLTWFRALRQVGRNLAANFVRSLRPEPHVDRLGRVAGNIRAVNHLLSGKLHPMRALDL